jgi:hypothetical protein
MNTVRLNIVALASHRRQFKQSIETSACVIRSGGGGEINFVMSHFLLDGYSHVVILE